MEVIEKVSFLTTQCEVSFHIDKRGYFRVRAGLKGGTKLVIVTKDYNQGKREYNRQVACYRLATED
jgi:hypothetical protein